MNENTQRPTEIPGQSAVPAVPRGVGAPGTRIAGRFVLLDRLGAGGGAVVVRARDEQLRSVVAVKLLRSQDRDLQRRFAREAELLANVRHPSLVQVLAHGSDGEHLYMALELVDGPNLSEQIATAGPMPWRQVLEIGTQLADALDALHRKGLIHRDVKPANIMLGADGVKLIDLGYARITEAYRDPEGFTPKPRRPTELGLAIGTPGYLPLEAGLVPADERFDVFGLGVTLYELLTGELPGIEPLRPLNEVYRGCDAPPDLGLVLAAALALEPSDRTQSAAELGRALAAIRIAHPESRNSPLLDGRYERVSVLGTGAKGDVYLANHRGSGHDVALKFLRSTHPDDRRRFEREVKLLALLDAPGLPRFYDFAAHLDRPYIAMARAMGLPAVRFCLASDQVRLKPDEVLAVGLQVARVLKYLHGRGVLHRDLNANNVMIELARTPRVTLVDLGCASVTDEFYAHASTRYLTPPEARVTIPDGGIERLAWSAPEVQAGEGWTGKSDVYSLGLLLFRLLTGKLPTLPGSYEPCPVQKYAPGCPDDLADVVLSALQPLPRDRPDAAQLEQLFMEILEDREDAALSRRAEQPPIEVVPPNPRPVAVAAAPAAPASTRGWTLFMNETATPSVAPPPRSATSDQPSPPAPAKPRRRFGVLTGALLVAFAWWGGRATAPSVLSASEASPAHAPTLARTQELPRPAPTPATSPSTGTSPAVLPAMHAVVDGAAPKIRACIKSVGEVEVEYSTVAGSEQFARIKVIGDADRGAGDCIRAVFADLRFTPTTAQTLVEEYRP